MKQIEERNLPRYLQMKSLSLCILVLFLLTGVIIFTVCFDRYQTTTKRLLKEDRATAGLLSLLLEERINRVISSLESYANRPLLMQAVKKKDAAGASKHMKTLISSTPGIDGLATTDKEGTVWNVFPPRPEIIGVNTAKRDWYLGVSKAKGPYVTDAVLRIVGEKDLAVQISVPFSDEQNELLGYMNSSLSTASIYKLLEQVPADPGCFYNVVDRKGNMVYSSRFQFKKELTPYPFFSARQQIKDHIRQSVPVPDPFLDNRTRYISYAPVSSIGYSVFIGRDSGAILQSEAGFFIQAATISLSLVIVITLMMFYLRKKLLLKITEAQILSAMELVKSDDRFRRAVEEAPFPIMIHAEDGEVLTISRTWTDLSGYAHADIPTIADWVEKAYGLRKQAVKADIEMLYSLAQRKEEGEYKIACRDGSELIWEFSSVSLGDLPDGRRIAISMASDITSRKRSEKLLHDSEEKYRLMVENLSSALIVHAPDTSIVFSNSMASKLLGLSIEQMQGTAAVDPVWCFIREDGTTIPLEEYPVNRVISTGRALFDYILGVRRPDIPDPVWVQCNAYPETSEDGQLQKVVVSFFDITGRKRAEVEKQSLEKQVQQVQKLESLGVLAGGIAHDFNNILMTIIGNADLALMRINKESPVVDNLHQIEKAAARAADLAKQMLAYSGKGKFIINNINLNTLLEEMLNMLQISISKKAVLRLNLHENLPTVEADATQMRQILMNLVINASEAIGDKSGVIAITTGCMDCDTDYLKGVWLDNNICEGLYVYLEIADSGCGMDKETIAKLFDPFFTTKFTGRGLGMSAVLGIVRGHKGAIRVYSEPKKGTTFKILLPASNRPPEIFNHELGKDDWQGSGTVLLVDDEDTVRGIGKELLKELGFTTITAEDGMEALEMYKAMPDIAFVLMDLTMPHMDGEQCFRELKKLNPEVKIIMSSGYNEQEVTQKFAGKGLAGFIQKPYKYSDLKEVIRQI